MKNTGSLIGTIKSIAKLLLLLSLLLPNSVFTQENKNVHAKYLDLPENEFLKDWYVLTPIEYAAEDNTPDTEAQKKEFETDIFTQMDLSKKGPEVVRYNNNDYTWKKLSSNDGIIDFQKEFGDKDYVTIYAFATIKIDADKTYLIGLGSDDAVKVFLNNHEVHRNFVGRPVIKDNDVFELNLKKGENQILLKVQNFTQGYGFSFRPVGGEVLSGLLNESISRGDMENIELLLKYNPNINSKTSEGLTPWQIAKIYGREDVAKLLAENGAVINHKYPEISDYVDAFVNSNLGDTTPGFAVLISKEGKVLHEKGYGYADIKNEIPVTRDTKFRIGSVTKQFVAAGILKLQEEGKLSVEDKLSEFIPDFPRGDDITIHHLLTHTSGIHSYTNQQGFLEMVAEKVEPQTIVDSIKSWELEFEPGEKWVYNNSAYFLLGEIIEIVSGKWYGDYLKAEFFDPIGMNNTGIYVNENPPGNDALGYERDGKKYEKGLNWNMSWAGGAGAMYSTVGDLFLWNEALFNGRVLTEESLTVAHTSVILNNGEVPQGVEYGYGWGIMKFRGVTEIGHSGGLHGFISYLTRVPEENLTIVALTNVTPTMERLDPGGVSNNFLQYALWDLLDPRESKKAIEIDEDKLADYTGRYDYGNAMVLMVTETEGKLYAQMTGQNQFQIYPMEKDVFFWKEVDAKINFVRNEKGVVTYGIHTQGGRDLKVLKLPEFVTMEIVAEDIEPYLGNYPFTNDLVIEISYVEGRLFIQATGQPKLEFHRVEEELYMSKEILISIRFFEENGKQKIEMNQAGIKNIIEKQ